MNIFEELIFSAEDIKVVSAKPQTAYQNITQEFYIVKKENSWHIILKLINLHPNFKLVAHTIENKNFPTFKQAKTEAQNFFKKHFPETPPYINYSLQKENESIYTIHLPNSTFNLGSIRGNSRNWSYFREYSCLTSKRIYKDLREYFPIKNSTRKKTLNMFINAVNQKLPVLYNQEVYVKTKTQIENKLIIPPEGWWVTLIKPDIDLELIFK